MDLEDLKKSIPQIFERVRKDVRGTIGRYRAGLSLGLVEMGISRAGFIGGMHFPPGTDIVMNKTPLKILLNQASQEIVRGYVYHILLHEYIHSLGIWDEQECRTITLRISEEIFENSDHPALILAKKGIGAYFPDLHLIHLPPDHRPEKMHVEYIRGFDEPSYEYYS